MTPKSERGLPKSERRYLKACELRAVEEDGKPAMLVGYAVVYNSLSEDLGYFRERISPGTFTESLKTADVRALVDHDPSQLLGRNKSGTLRLIDEPKGLRAEIDLPDTSYARDLLEKIRRKDLDGMSFSFKVSPEGDTWFTDEEGNTLRTIIKAEIDDVSAVTYPAYTDTSIAQRSLDSWTKNHRPPPDAGTELRRLRLKLNAR
jgi:HK97 family phage prohead protease